MPKRDAKHDATSDARIMLLRALASGVAGEPIDVLAGKPGEPSWSTGKQIFLDPSLSQNELREACVAHALLIAAGSLRVPGVRRLVGRPAAAKQYMALELARATRTFADRLPQHIEQSFLALAHTELPAHLGMLRPARLVLTRTSTPSDNAKVARTAEQRESQLPEHDEDDELDENNDSFLKLFSTPLGGGAISDFFLKLMGFGRAKGSDDKAADDGSGSLAGSPQAATGRASKHAQQLAETPTQATTLVPRTPRFSYPEWNERAKRYHRDWVHVHELVPDAGEGAR